ncbi:MAG: DUF5320 domain-containing protein [Patescibacteria group bacterium]|jgi:hypothetical protein
MPRLDGTGPLGNGPQDGRGQGDCGKRSCPGCRYLRRIFRGTRRNEASLTAGSLAEQKKILLDKLARLEEQEKDLEQS